jgi:hypothetical protein
MKSQFASSIATAVTFALLATSPSQAQPGGPVSLVGAAGTSLIQSVQVAPPGQKGKIVKRPGPKVGALPGRRGGGQLPGGRGVRFGGGGGGNGAAAAAAGIAAGALIGGMLAAPRGEGAAGPRRGGASAEDIAYCARTFRSYDPRSGTYIGPGGQPYRCP